jgi:predicted tellurium resistance membrane protein TerC
MSASFTALASPLLGPLTAFIQVVLIDLVLAGDNAVAVGMAASGLGASQRRRVIMAGLAAAVVLRISLALVALQLLSIIGLTLAGGLLLLLVCYTCMHRPRPAGPKRRRRRTSASRSSRFSSPTSRCRWTMCWRWRALRTSIRACCSSAWRCRSY